MRRTLRTLGLTLPLWITVAVPAFAGEPNIQRGAVIATQGTMAGAPPCAQCHAFSGASDGSGAFPRLTAQSGYYLGKQLRDFASGVRDNAIMTPVARALAAQDIEDVAAYYAASDGPFPPLAAADRALIETGRQIARRGIEAKAVQACNSCHGPDGAGLPPAIPYLAGQYAQTIVAAIDAWRRGDRRSSPGAMAYVAKQLSNDEIAAVAAYFQQVRAFDKSAAAK